MAKRDSKLLGPILIVVGLLLLLGQLGVPGFPMHWPLLLIAVGAGFLLRWLRNREEGAHLFTATLLILLGLLFQWDAWFDLRVRQIWPYFPFAVGCAFCARGFADPRDRASQIGLGLFLIAFSFVFWVVGSQFFRSFVRGMARMVTTLVQVAIPLGLIAWGSWLVFGRKRGLGAKGKGEPIPEKLEPPESIRTDPDGDDENIPATD